MLVSKLIEVIRRLLLTVFYIVTLGIPALIFRSGQNTTQENIQLVILASIILYVGHKAINWIFLADEE